MLGENDNKDAARKELDVSPPKCSERHYGTCAATYQYDRRRQETIYINRMQVKT